MAGEPQPPVFCGQHPSQHPMGDPAGDSEWGGGGVGGAADGHVQLQLEQGGRTRRE